MKSQVVKNNQAGGHRQEVCDGSEAAQIKTSVGPGRKGLVPLHIGGEISPVHAVLLSKHPRPSTDFGVSQLSSYLNRHLAQLNEFADHVLPLIVGKKSQLGENNIKIAVVGAGLDEPCSVMAAVRGAFVSRPEWGKIDEWKIQFHIYEINEEVLRESFERVAGRSPVASARSGLNAPTNKHSIEMLNQDGCWRSSSVTGFVADATNAAAIRFMRASKYDAVFMNATFGNLNTIEARKLSTKYARLEAFFLGDLVSDAPIPHLSSSHAVEYRVALNRNQGDYCIAVPKAFTSAWRENITGRPSYPLNQVAVDRPRLRMLLVSDMPNHEIEYWLRENSACWSKHHKLNNPEIQIVSVSQAARGGIKAKIANQYFDLAIFEPDVGSLQLEIRHDVYKLFGELNNNLKVLVVSPSDIASDAVLDGYEPINISNLKSEEKVEGLLEPVAQRRGLTYCGVGLQPRIDPGLAGLSMLANENPLGRLDLILGLSSHLTEIRSLLMSCVKVQKSQSPLDSDDVDFSNNLTPVILKSSKSWDNVYRQFCEVAQKNQKFISKHGKSLTINNLDYHIRKHREEVLLSEKVIEDLDFCLSSPADKLYTWANIHWGGCGYNHPRWFVLKDLIIPQLVTSNEELDKITIAADLKAPEMKRLAKAFNKMLPEAANFNRSIAGKMKQLISKLEAAGFIDQAAFDRETGVGK